MLFYITRIRLQRRIMREYHFYKVLFRSFLIEDTHKILYVDVSEIALNRYLYSFLKFFQIEGYTVYLPKSRKIIDVLSKKSGEFQYISWLLEEGFVKFGKPKKKNVKIWLGAEQLSNDYYSELFNRINHKRTFHLPMCEYPYFYHKNCWDRSFNLVKPRIRSLFMMGNCDKRYYRDIADSNFFNLPSRYDIVEFLYKRDYYYDLETMEDLDEYVLKGCDSKVLLIDTSKKFKIGGIELKRTLSSFHFYLALPGVVVPYSHNLVEAMSMGCIPVIHKNYADIMYPKLSNGQNSFTYKDFEDLDALIKRLFNLEETELERMRVEVLNYYNEYLSPKAVVETIEKNNFDKIFIQAEGLSLSYLNIQKEN